MMQCEKDALKRIDDVIAAVHRAVKMRPRCVAPVMVRRAEKAVGE